MNRPAIAFFREAQGPHQCSGKTVPRLRGPSVGHASSSVSASPRRRRGRTPVACLRRVRHHTLRASRPAVASTFRVHGVASSTRSVRACASPHHPSAAGQLSPFRLVVRSNTWRPAPARPAGPLYRGPTHSWPCESTAQGVPRPRRHSPAPCNATIRPSTLRSRSTHAAPKRPSTVSSSLVPIAPATTGGGRPSRARSITRCVQKSRQLLMQPRSSSARCRRCDSRSRAGGNSALQAGARHSA
jgi:hypothetical protein